MLFLRLKVLARIGRLFPVLLFVVEQREINIGFGHLHE